METSLRSAWEGKVGVVQVEASAAPLWWMKSPKEGWEGRRKERHLGAGRRAASGVEELPKVINKKQKSLVS